MSSDVEDLIGKTIHLDSNNHVTLFPSQKGLEQAYYDYFGQSVERSTDTYDAREMIIFSKWAIKNNYKED